jgi:hypothetical protein
MKNGKFIELTVKLLGIDIDYQFNQHISNLCRKASQQLNVLKRLGSYLTKLNKLTIFHTFILISFIKTLNNRGSSMEP